MTPMDGKVDVGERVASFTDYTAAQKAVSALIAGDVPAREIAIVGTGLRSIERVTGKLGYATAARQGAMNGVLLGLLFAAIFVLGTSEAQLQLFIGVMLVGMAVGMLLSLITYTIVRRRRDYASVMQVVADHYDVMVQPTSIHKARGLLGTAPSGTVRVGGPVPPPAVPTRAEPPRYGERVDPAAPVVPAPVAPPAVPQRPAADEPPRYGERITPTPPSGDETPPDA